MMAFAALLLVACDTGVTAGKLLPGEGEVCDTSGCRDAMVCAHDGICAADGSLGTAAVGDDCSDTEECSFSLECSSANVCADADDAGTAGAGDTCANDDDCQAGYECSEKSCVDLEIPFWEGGACPADEAEGEFRVMFQIPDLPTSSELDFFAMPFPNDLRLDTAGHPMMDGFPSPGESAPAVDELLSLMAEPYGFGTDPVVYFRFNRAHDLASIKALEDGANVHFASIDPDAADYGELPAFQFFTRTSRGRYICQNWLAVTTYDGRPLLRNHRYAVWVEKGITDQAGGEIFRDDDFVTMMQDTRPNDVTDAKAYDQFGPLRDFVDAKGLTRGNIVGGTVFSTGDPLSWVRYFREVVDAEDSPVSVGTASSCSASPCALSCSGASGVTEQHALLTLTDFTKGNGAVEYSSTFRPQRHDTEETCLVLAYPNGEAPEGGWPLALYVGDLGGSAQDALTSGLASALAAEGVATASVALPGHGDRAGGNEPISTWFNTEKPAAWRGHALQALADAHAVLRATRESESLSFNEENMWVIGQGTGGEVATGLLALDKDVLGGVLGNPGGRIATLSTSRTEPYDVAHALQRSFADSNLGRSHPLVALLQTWMGPVDPVTAAESVVREPETNAKHLFIIQGIGEEQFPVDATSAVLRAASIPTAGEVLLDFGQATVTLPTTENVSTDNGRRTAASVQVNAGHNAMITDELSRLVEFVGTGANEGAPTIVE